ncbi:hypothetical protein ACIA8K_27440 [Catenuloplanes sp. NPDC051500]|uniref:hypothetical protein n=1 Tax=Catenuloplanes sp. NPDC051500 TaxID=3363959 RepID=UPI0037BD98E4
MLEYLIMPALKEAGYEAIPPAASGSTLILSDIVRNLEDADLVLCDMSTLNANVMLELGIRIALDRPICLIRDDQTPMLPFDTSVINTYMYDSTSLLPWKTREQQRALAAHILATRNKSDGRNQLWKVFGLTQRAQSPVEKIDETDPRQARIELLEQQVAVLIKQLQSGSGTAAQAVPDSVTPEQSAQEELAFPDAPPAVRDLLREASRIAGEVNARVTPVEINGDEVVLDLGVYVLGLSRREDIINSGHRLGLRVRFLGGQSPDSPAG